MLFLESVIRHLFVSHEHGRIQSKNWCKMNHLVLNIDKTKEMVIDFRKTIIPPNKIVIDDKEVERVGD